MRVVFVDNLLFEDAEGIRRYILQPHLGLISLIAVLEKAGHHGLLYDPKVEISRGKLSLDEELYRRIASQILQLKPDVVGFTSLGCNFICTAKVAAYLRQWHPSIPIMLGGPHATVLDKTILQHFSQFDLIARNEAENTILPILDALVSGNFRGVPGVTYRDGPLIRSNPGEPNIADLDSLPIPAYHHYPVRALGLTSLRMDAGRGCPFQCTFCSTASFFGRKYRLKSADRLRDEMDYLNQTYDISDFALTHDLFTVNRRKVIEFCDAIEGRNYTWKCSARMDCVDDELLERMSAAGCRSIYYGIEAGSARMQEISKKRLDLGLFDPILDSTQRRHMSSTVSFITGYPEETRADQQATLDLIGNCFERDSVPLNIQLHLLTPEPGTQLLNEYRDKIVYDGHISDFNFPTLEADDESVISGHAEVFINHHYFPSVLPRRRHIFITTAYQVIYGLGFPLLRYILRRFEGRFSEFMESMENWARLQEESAVCDQALVERYFAATFGASHHITGLVRYMLNAMELRRRVTNGVRPQIAHGPSENGSYYVLSPRAAVLRRVPDCPNILARLVRRDDKLPAGALLSQRYDFLLHFPPTESDAIRNFELSQASAAFLDCFRVPRRWPGDEVFARELGGPAPPSEFVDTLVKKGVLEPCVDAQV
jgi:radical SAM superfamily enzyme YgiQ (UPF0313 family)